MKKLLAPVILLASSTGLQAADRQEDSHLAAASAGAAAAGDNKLADSSYALLLNKFQESNQVTAQQIAAAVASAKRKGKPFQPQENIYPPVIRLMLETLERAHAYDARYPISIDPEQALKKGLHQEHAASIKELKYINYSHLMFPKIKPVENGAKEEYQIQGGHWNEDNRLGDPIIIKPKEEYPNDFTGATVDIRSIPARTKRTTFFPSSMKADGIHALVKDFINSEDVAFKPQTFEDKREGYSIRGTVNTLPFVAYWKLGSEKLSSFYLDEKRLPKAKKE